MNRFEIKVNGQNVGAVDHFEIKSNQMANEILPKDRFNSQNDLIMRPTDLEVGYYENEEDPRIIYMVAKYTDGNNYICIWFENGKGKEYQQEGDILFEGTYIKSQNIDYGDQDIVKIENMDIKYEKCL